MQVGKLNPNFTSGSSTAGAGKLNFPGFQKVLDFTSAGSESSVSVTVDGDTDKEYIVYVRNLHTTQDVQINFNGDSTVTNYGFQYLVNNGGTITANRAANYEPYSLALTETWFSILTPTGFIKTCFWQSSQYTSGTTIGWTVVMGHSWNNTANVTSLTFVSASGNFTAGTRIVVYARRTQ